MLPSCCSLLTQRIPHHTVTQVEAAASIQGLQAITFYAADTQQANNWGPTYNLSKALLNKATRLLSKSPELRDRRITCNVVCPGWCKCVLCTAAAQHRPHETSNLMLLLGRRTELGGPRAHRSALQGAQSIVTTLLRCLEEPGPPTGRFFRDGTELGW